MLRLLLACISSKLQVEGFCVKRNPKSRSSVHQELSLLFCCQVICTDPFLPFTKDLGVLESRKAELQYEMYEGIIWQAKWLYHSTQLTGGFWKSVENSTQRSRQILTSNHCLVPASSLTHARLLPALTHRARVMFGAELCFLNAYKSVYYPQIFNHPWLNFQSTLSSLVHFITCFRPGFQQEIDLRQYNTFG